MDEKAIKQIVLRAIEVFEKTKPETEGTATRQFVSVIDGRRIVVTIGMSNSK